MMVRALAISQVDLPNTPGASKVVEDGRIPARESRPVDGFIAYNAACEAGQLMDPWVSVPSARGANPAATATAGPPDEPQGD